MTNPTDAPACLPPARPQRGPRRYKVPKGAVDTHAHVIGLPPLYPFVEDRSYTPPEATAADYLAMLDATGMTYGVLIQVSVHGTDNRLMLAALGANRQRLRGIAVIPLGMPDKELTALKDNGVVGLRLNTLYGGGIGFEDVEAYGALCRDMGWHLQFLIDARQLTPLGPSLSRLQVPYVIDHMGHFPTSEGLKSQAFLTLAGLVRDGAYVKLQGAFRNSVAGPPYGDTTPFARALNDVAPERSLWGSDWPHVSVWKDMPNTGDLLDLMADWVPDERRRQLLFVDNPHKLYGFPPAA